MKRTSWCALLCLLLAAIVSAQTTPVQVTAKLIDGTGNVSREAFLTSSSATAARIERLSVAIGTTFQNMRAAAAGKSLRNSQIKECQAARNPDQRLIDSWRTPVAVGSMAFWSGRLTDLGGL
jgi:hypothetical protein